MNKGHKYKDKDEDKDNDKDKDAKKITESLTESYTHGTRTCIKRKKIKKVPFFRDTMYRV